MGFNHLLLLSFMSLLALTVNAGPYYQNSHHSPPPPPHPKTERKEVESIGMQGMIYCKAGSKYMPLEGAVVRITCKAVDKHGYEYGCYTLLSETGKSGYFLATLSTSELKDVRNITEYCKGYLHMSSSLECSAPTDVNSGISGSYLSGPRYLPNKKMNLYSVRPFEYMQLVP